MGHSSDATGKPVITPTPTQTVADMQAIADYAEKVGGLLKVSSSERTSLTSGQTKPGWLISETDTGSLFLVTAASPQGVPVWGDSGWVSLSGSLVSGWSVQSPDTFAYRVRGRSLFFRGRLDSSTGAATTILGAALPTYARPSQEYNARVFVTSGEATSYVVSVTTSGQVIVYKGSNAVNDLPMNAIGGIPLD